MGAGGLTVEVATTSTLLNLQLAIVGVVSVVGILLSLARGQDNTPLVPGYSAALAAMIVSASALVVYSVDFMSGGEAVLSLGETVSLFGFSMAELEVIMWLMTTALVISAMAIAGVFVARGVNRPVSVLLLVHTALAAVAVNLTGLVGLAGTAGGWFSPGLSPVLLIGGLAAIVSSIRLMLRSRCQ